MPAAGRPSPWASKDASRIIVVECYGYPISIIAKRLSSTVSDLHLHAACTSMQSSNSLGTAQNLDSLLIELWLSATACTWNPEVWPRTPSTSSSLRGDA